MIDFLVSTLASMLATAICGLFTLWARARTRTPRLLIKQQINSASRFLIIQKINRKEWPDIARRKQTVTRPALGVFGPLHARGLFEPGDLLQDTRRDVQGHASGHRHRYDFLAIFPDVQHRPSLGGCVFLIGTGANCYQVQIRRGLVVSPAWQHR